MAFNETLARQALAAIELLEKPNEAGDDPLKGWSQADWRCGSGMCFAGWVAHLSGYTQWDDEVDSNGKVVRWSTRCRRPHSSVWDEVENVADKLLGLDETGHNLFDGSNELDDLRAEIRELVDPTDELDSVG